MVCHDMSVSKSITCPDCGAPQSPIEETPFYCGRCGRGFEVVLQPLESRDTVVRLHSAGHSKIMAIKAVRCLTGMGLADAKNLVEGRMPVDFHVVPSQYVKEGMDCLDLCGGQYEVLDAQPQRETATAAAPDNGPAAFVTLLNSGPNKIEVIKLIRMLTGLGLGESKDLCDRTPSRFAIKKGRAVSDVTRSFTSVGARVRVESA